MSQQWGGRIGYVPPEFGIKAWSFSTVINYIFEFFPANVEEFHDSLIFLQTKHLMLQKRYHQHKYVYDVRINNVVRLL